MVPQNRTIEWKTLLHRRLNIGIELVPISSVAQANVDKWTLLSCGTNTTDVSVLRGGGLDSCSILKEV